METPDYNSELDGYGDLKNMALDNIEAMGYCTRRNQPSGCNNSVPRDFPF